MSSKNIISQIWHDEDGWWAILKDGWQIDDCSGVREDTKKKLMERIKLEAKSTKNSQT